MNKTLFLLFILSIFYIVPSYSETNVGNNYVVCATDDNGAIYVNDQGGGDLSSFAYASRYALNTSAASFDLVKTEDGTDIGASCDITPQNYKLKFFKLGFCTENPYREFVDAASNTIGADLSSCVDIFDDPEGKEVNIRPDEEVDLLEGAIVLPLGRYPFIYFIIDNIVNIKHTQTFVAAPGAAAPVIHGYNPDPNDMGDNARRGSTCWTAKDDSGDTIIHTQSFEIAATGTGATTIRGYPLPTNYTGSQPFAKLRCASAVGTGNAKLDWFVTIINSFGRKMCKFVNDACSQDKTKFRNANLAELGFNDNFPNIAQAHYLLKSDNTIATDPDDVTKLLWTQVDLGNIINITEDTIGLKLNFKTNNAMTMGIHQDANDDDSLMSVQIWGNTIFGQVQTKTRRARGAWR